MADTIGEQVASFGDWITQFEFQGTRYGGTYNPSDDQRVLRFIRELGTYEPTIGRADRRLRILECGSFEGAQTAMLAKAFPSAEIVAVDVREESIRKSQFLHSLYGLTNVSLRPRRPRRPPTYFS
jgi:tRNA G46 methylase TrmB